MATKTKKVTETIKPDFEMVLARKDLRVGVRRIGDEITLTTEGLDTIATIEDLASFADLVQTITEEITADSIIGEVEDCDDCECCCGCCP